MRLLLSLVSRLLHPIRLRSVGVQGASPEEPTFAHKPVGRAHLEAPRRRRSVRIESPLSSRSLDRLDHRAERSARRPRTACVGNLHRSGSSSRPSMAKNSGAAAGRSRRRVQQVLLAGRPTPAFRRRYLAAKAGATGAARAEAGWRGSGLRV